MQYKILASDYDNTLVPFGESQPRPAMVKAVKKLQAAGGKFVLSTGRSWSAINRKGQLGGIRFDYAITCNGACVVDKNGTIVAEHPMTSEEMYALVDFCEDYNYPLQFDFKDAYYAYCEYDILHKYYEQMNSVGLDCVDGEDQDRHLIDMPHAAFCLFPEGALERFSEKYGHLGLHFMQTGGQLPDGSRFYDIVRGGIDKSTGLADLCEKMGLSLAEAVAAGDSANDVGMLKAACPTAPTKPKPLLTASSAMCGKTALLPLLKSCGSTARRRSPPTAASALHGRRWNDELRTRLL